MKNQFKQKTIFFILFLAVIFLFPAFSFAAIKKTPAYQASLVKQSFSATKIEANKEISFEVKFKNTGTATWYNNGLNYLTLNTTDPSERESTFYHSSWPYSFQATKMQEKKVKPGEIGTFKFILHSPTIFETKKYVEKFRLVANNLTLVEGKGVITISINVKGIPKPKEESKRFNLFYKTKPTNGEVKQKIKIVSNEKYEIKDKDGFLLISQPAGSESEIEFNFQTKRYFLNINGQRILGTDSFLRFYPDKQSEGILEITNYDSSYQLDKDGAGINTNKFQGTLEINYAPETERLLIINETPEKYFLNYFKKATNFNPNELISDSDFTNYNSMTLAEIQTFLEEKGSYLANYVIPTEMEIPFCYKGGKSSIKVSQENAGKKVSELIFAEAQEHQINPQVILVTIQKEQSGITIMPDNNKLAWLLGYGKNDTMANCLYSFNQAKSQAELGGVGNQIAYSIASLQKNFNNGIGPQINGVTSKVGDKIFLSNGSKEPIEVSLSNKATACLYKYTPHVYNGNYNFWKNYQAWFVNPQPYKLAFSL
ncbi:hypothetical protein HY750_03625 [Candidatus Kuenenbacteria bacterium]|nr:hypothetical protein [Candidatus Kuenenbacteria bacterium]